MRGNCEGALKKSKDDSSWKSHSNPFLIDYKNIPSVFFIIIIYYLFIYLL